jgi:hypothetical protein
VGKTADRDAVRDLVTEGRKVFFFEKRKQETFDRAVPDLSGAPPTGTKSFLVLFFRTELFCLP